MQMQTRHDIIKNTPIHQTTDRSINVVYETMDHDKFKFLKPNRKVKSTTELEQKILERGGILSPITVDADFGIIDGQRRVKVAKKLNIPVPYIISHGRANEDIIAMNSANKNWRLQDFLDSYAVQGFEDYVLMKEILRRVNFLKISHIIGFNEDKAVYKGASERATSEFKSGYFKFTEKNRELIQQFSDFAVEVEAEVKHLKWNSVFTMVLYYLWCDERLEKDRLKAAFTMSIIKSKGETYPAHITRSIVLNYNSLAKAGKLRFRMEPSGSGYRFVFVSSKKQKEKSDE